MNHTLGSLADVGALVRATRVSRRLTQRALAARLGLSVRLVGELELGERDLKASNLFHVLGRLGFDVQAVSRHAEPGPPDDPAPARQRVRGPRAPATARGRRRGA